MDMLLNRIVCTDASTVGELSIDGAFECFTLEDIVRADGIKIFGETAIPPGRYEVDITPSPRFKRDLPLLKSVAGFDGIRIHSGNSAEDTLGCILVGRRKAPDRVLESVLAFKALFAKLQAAKASGEPMSITIKNTAVPVA